MEEGCTARGIWEQVRDRLVDTLDTITLAELTHQADSRLENECANSP
jgi:DNA-binding IscR family transcriptional regulator